MALVESVAGYGAGWNFYVLLVNGPASLPEKIGGVSLYGLQLADLTNFTLAEPVVKKYKPKSDELRWSLKPVLISYLLEQGADQVIYLDNDLYFFKDPAFLFDELNNASVLLCPHWRIQEPGVNKDWFLVNFTDGLYNAGFVGASAAGLAAMHWWARACAFACEKTPRKGLWDDQKYLDLIPAAYPSVSILQHRGCNVAFWNVQHLSGTNTDGEALMDNLWPVVFIHVTDKLTKLVSAGKAQALKPYLEAYQKALQ